MGRAIVEGNIVHIPDVFEDAEYSNWGYYKRSPASVRIRCPCFCARASQWAYCHLPYCLASFTDQADLASLYLRLLTKPL